MSFDRLENVPSPLSVHRISGQLMQDEKALQRFRPQSVETGSVFHPHVPDPIEFDGLGRQACRGAHVHLVARVR